MVSQPEFPDAPSFSIATHPGRGKAVNQDSARGPDGILETVLARKGYLYIVADGIGGHQAGEVASQIAVETIQRLYYDDPDVDVAASLQRAVAEANAEIHRQAQAPAYSGMGSAVVAAVVQGEDLVVANVGDSRAYLLCGGALQQLTSDHTWVAERVAAGLLSPEEAAHHEMRHVVTRSLGSQPTVEVDVRPYQFLPGDRLLLCSDGVWEPVPDAEIPRLLGQGGPQQAAAALVNRAMAVGGGDDATALVVGVGRDGLLEQVARMVSAVLASPGQRAAAIAAGAVLILALIVCSTRGLWSGGGAQTLPTVTPAPTMVVHVSPTPTNRSVTPVETQEISTDTPLPDISEPTIIPTESSSPVNACSNVVVNADFESDGGWELQNEAVYTNEQFHSGARSMRVGRSAGYSSGHQFITLPSVDSATLRLWLYHTSCDAGDVNLAVIYDQNGRRDNIQYQCSIQGWMLVERDISAYSGQRIKLYFGTSNDGFGGTAILYVDDVELVCP